MPVLRRAITSGRLPSARLSRALIAGGLALGVIGLTSGPAIGAATVDVPGVGPVNSVGGGAIPPIRHVWTIILENSDEGATLAQDKADGSGELTTTLQDQGAWLPNYFGIGHNSLDNYVALASAQGPTEQTQGDCGSSTDIVGHDPANPATPTTIDANGQALDTAAQVSSGSGCTYPANVPTLGMQLSKAGYSWRTYAQGMAEQPTKRRTTCPAPGYGGDLNHPAAGDSSFADNYRTKHDPELYFQGVTGTGGTAPLASCDQEEVDLEQLPSDLASDAATPTYSLIVPDLCNDAHDSAFAAAPSAAGLAGCAANSAGPDDKTPAASEGVEQADNFLRYWVPQILGSPAYKDNGLLMITFDEGTEGLSCCGEIKSPNLPLLAANGAPDYLDATSTPDTPATNGGGQIGMVAISPFITPGTVSTVAYNHYSYVRTIEDMFKLTPDRTGIAGSDGQGHIGFAGSQRDLSATPLSTAMNAPASMGQDVFDNPSGAAVSPALPDSRLAVLLPIAGLMVCAGLLTGRMRRQAA